MSDLADLLKTTRAARRLSLRAAAEQIGVAFTTVDRIERGHECTHSAAKRVELWIHGPLEGLTVAQAYANGYAAGVAEAAAAIERLRP